jgi:hypothetical protein
MAPVANGFSGTKSEIASTSHDIITINERISHARQNVRKEEMSAKKGVPLIIDNGEWHTVSCWSSMLNKDNIRVL